MREYDIFLKFFKFIENEIGILELEQWVYQCSELEKKIGEDNYQFLLEYNYKANYADIEIKNFILQNIISQKEFVSWKVEKVLNSTGIKFPEDELFIYAKHNPEFLKGKVSKFREFKRDKEIEIIWAQEIKRFLFHTSELKKRYQEFLHIGTYEDSYINLIVNEKDEIWLAYDVVDKKEYFASNIIEAIEKLIMGNVDK